MIVIYNGGIIVNIIIYSLDLDRETNKFLMRLLLSIDKFINLLII